MRVDKKFEPSIAYQIVQHLNHIRLGIVVSMAQHVSVGKPLLFFARELDAD